MDADQVAIELRKLNGRAPVWPGNEPPDGPENLKWLKWSAAELLIRSWEQLLKQRQESASRKKSRSTSTERPHSTLDYLGRPRTISRS